MLCTRSAQFHSYVKVAFVLGRLSFERSVSDMLHLKAGGHMQFTLQLETLH